MPHRCIAHNCAGTGVIDFEEFKAVMMFKSATQEVTQELARKSEVSKPESTKANATAATAADDTTAAVATIATTLPPQLSTREAQPSSSLG